MSGYKAYKAMKRANASQSRLIEKQAKSIEALEENIASHSRLTEELLTRNGALEGVVEIAREVVNAGEAGDNWTLNISNPAFFAECFMELKQALEEA